MALPCYADEGRTIDTLIDDELQKAGLSIDLDARQALKRSLGGDRLASRGELEKLVLYAAGANKITLEQVKRLAGDVSALSVDDAIDAALEGNIASFDLAFGRLCASSNQAANQILGSALRRFQSLQLMRAAMDADGRSASAAVASARPPIFFTRRKLIENALVRWNADTIARALAALQSAVLQIRKRSDLAEPIGRQALLAIAVEAARRERR